MDENTKEHILKVLRDTDLLFICTSNQLLTEDIEQFLDKEYKYVFDYAKRDGYDTIFLCEFISTVHEIWQYNEIVNDRDKLFLYLIVTLLKERGLLNMVDCNLWSDIVNKIKNSTE